MTFCFTLKKYWKQFVVLLFLATISTLTVFLLIKNGTGNIYNLIKSGAEKNQIIYTFYGFKQKPLIEFGNNWKKYLLFMVFFIGVFSSLFTAFSLYYRDYLVGLIDYDLRETITTKLFKLKQSLKVEKLLDLVQNKVANFSNHSVYIIDQIYVFILSLTVILFEATSVSSHLWWWVLGYLLIGSLFTFGLNYWLYQKELVLQKILRKRIQQENVLLNHKQLIIKKGLVDSLSQDYKKIRKITLKRTNSRHWVNSVSQAFPDYLWIELASYFLLIFFPVGDMASFMFLSMSIRVFSSLKRLIKGLNSSASYLASKKQINWFFKQPERDDVQQGLTISEPINSLILSKVYFSYENSQFILNDLTLEFKKGNINYLEAPNGYGKSTIVNLIMGLYQPSKGTILINDKYELKQINLSEWRKKIAYAEHNNLIENGLSTGQKQWKDLQLVFLSQKDKDIFIFDEAINNLDVEKEKEFQKRLSILSLKKLVIAIKAV